jgi:hypothetical protein
MGEDPDALAQLVEAWEAVFFQIRLPGKNKLQELLLLSLVVRELPDDLQD